MGQCVNPRATEFMEKLNAERGWNLVGGHKSREFMIPSGRTAAGKYYFDGFDKDRMIIFEYDEPHHESKNGKELDLLKEEQLKLVLKSYNLTATLVRYSEKYNKFTEKQI
jgi:hypothetical protein